VIDQRRRRVRDGEQGRYRREDLFHFDPITDFDQRRQGGRTPIEFGHKLFLPKRAGLISRSMKC